MSKTKNATIVTIDGAQYVLMNGVAYKMMGEQTQVRGNRKGDAPEKKMVLNHNGKLRTEAQAANDLRLHLKREAREAQMTPEQKAHRAEMVEKIKASKEHDVEVCKKLQKALKLNVTPASSAFSVKEALEMGWSPKSTSKQERKEELKAAKAKARK